jgi:hypothetical protein
VLLEEINHLLGQGRQMLGVARRDSTQERDEIGKLLGGLLLWAQLQHLKIGFVVPQLL